MSSILTVDGSPMSESFSNLLYDRITFDTQTTMEVQELRHQVRLLSAELQQLRNLNGSTQSLQVQCSSDAGATATGRVSWTSVHVVGGASPDSSRFDDFKPPPLPPRLYRPPAKPQRTFAQNGLPPFNNGSLCQPNWVLKPGISMDCLSTMSKDGPTLPPRIASKYNAAPKLPPPPPPPPPPKSYRKPLPQNFYLEQSLQSASVSSTPNTFFGSVQNLFHPNNVCRPLPTAELVVKRDSRDDYSAILKNVSLSTNVVRNGETGTCKPIDITKIKDLSHFVESVTDETFAEALHDGLSEGTCWYQIGPVLLYLNIFNESLWKPYSFSSTKGIGDPVVSLVNNVYNYFHDSEVSQAVVVSGERNSGKTCVSMQVLKQLFYTFGAKASDVCRNFGATVDVLSSLATVRRSNNAASNQAAFLYELHIADSILMKAKVHCCFLDQSRVCGRIQGERNFQIFYQILAGLTVEEKKKFHLTNHTLNTLAYLSGTVCQNFNQSQHVEQDRNQFLVWKSSLALLGIAFSDVMRVLASVLLLGNVKFVEGTDGADLDIKSSKDLEAVAALLGVTCSTLFKSLTKYSTLVKRQWIKSSRSAKSINEVRDSLAKTLYYRCVCAIVRRANSVKTSARPGSGISSSDESCAHDSGIGMTCQNSEGTISSSQNSAQGADGLISVFDLFGFDNNQFNYFEQLCVNYANEKVQSFYRTKLFRTNQKLLKDEGFENEYDLDIVNSALFDDDALLDLFLSPKMGVYYLLDEECASPSGSSSHFHQMLKQYNKSSKHLEFAADHLSNNGQLNLNFTVKHFGKTPVVYNASDFVSVNRDLLSPDLMKIFNSSSCNFGFVSHLFAQELQIDERQHGQTTYRITPTAVGCDFGGKKSTTFAQDFTFHVDTFVKSLMSCKVHFIQCIKSNSTGLYGKFEDAEVMRQINQLDTLPLVRLLASGLPYCVKLKEFNDRYRFLVVKCHGAFLAKAPSLIEDTNVLLDCYLKTVDESNLPYVSNHWKLGTQYVFLSQGAYEQLETLRSQHRSKSARVIQKHVRKWLKKHGCSSKLNSWTVSNGRPKPLIGSSLSSTSMSVSPLILEKVVSRYGIKLNESVPPPLPAYRKYVVAGEQKISFPQRRIMVNSFADSQAKVKLNVGDVVTAIGWSGQQKQLIVREPKGETIFVPLNSTKLCA